MFDAANLPDDDAWVAMTKKMKEAEQGKAKAEQENSSVSVIVFSKYSSNIRSMRRLLKTRIAELEIQHEQ